MSGDITDAKLLCSLSNLGCTMRPWHYPLMIKKKKYPDGFDDGVNIVILHVIRHCWLTSITVQR